jgi:hypothetical protein
MQFIMRIALVLYLIVILHSTGFGQECADFHSRSCPIPDFSYFYDQQSGSFALRAGETAELRIIVFEVTDYYVSLCSHRRFKNVRLRIIEDSPQRTLLYDNSAEEYVNNVQFTNDVTRRLILEVSVPEDANDKSDARERCVGVLLAKRIRVENI